MRSPLTRMMPLRLQQTEDQFADDGLPGPARPDHDRHMPGGHGKTDVPQNDVVIECQGDMFEHDDRYFGATVISRHALKVLAPFLPA